MRQHKKREAGQFVFCNLLFHHFGKLFKIEETTSSLQPLTTSRCRDEIVFVTLASSRLVEHVEVWQQNRFYFDCCRLPNPGNCNASLPLFSRLSCGALSKVKTTHRRRRRRRRRRLIINRLRNSFFISIV